MNDPKQNHKTAPNLCYINVCLNTRKKRAKIKTFPLFKMYEHEHVLHPRLNYSYSW